MLPTSPQCTEQPLTKAFLAPNVGSACGGGTEALWVGSPNGREVHPPIFPLHSCPERNLKSCQEGNPSKVPSLLITNSPAQAADPLPPKQRGEVVGEGRQDHVLLSPPGCSKPTPACPTPPGPALGLCPSCLSPLWSSPASVYLCSPSSSLLPPTGEDAPWSQALPPGCTDLSTRLG